MRRVSSCLFFEADTVTTFGKPRHEEAPGTQYPTTDHFSSSAGPVGRVRMCPSVWTITFKLHSSDPDIRHAGSSFWPYVGQVWKSRS